MRVALPVPRSRESDWSPLAHGSHTPLLFSQAQTPCPVLHGVCFCPPTLCRLLSSCNFFLPLVAPASSKVPGT